MSSSNNTNKTNVPEAKEALTSAQAGSVGGYMVKKMIEEQEKKMAGK